VAVAGNYAYVADEYAGLQVIDVSSPTNCVRVGGYDIDGLAYGVAVAGSYAYVACQVAGLHVIDISDPTNPERVGGSRTNGYAWGVAVADNNIYLANGNYGLHVFYHPPQPRLEVVGMDMGTFRLRVSGPPGRSVQVKSSADLVNWVDHGAPFTLDVTPTLISDSAAGTNAHRFYRALRQAAEVLPRPSALKGDPPMTLWFVVRALARPGAHFRLKPGLPTASASRKCSPARER
jgi:hypothetical protein